MPSLVISGAGGIYAARVNGIWDVSGEVVDGMFVYFKRGDTSLCLEYNSFYRGWRITSMDRRVIGLGGYAYVNCDPPAPVEQCTAVWNVSIDPDWEAAQPTVRVLPYV